jgi:Alanine racemase, N-terminal domain
VTSTYLSSGPIRYRPIPSGTELPGFLHTGDAPVQPELALYVDSARWFAHLGGVLGQHPGRIVPVAKGNGYGFTNEFLASVSSDLGVDAIAVGTIDEARRVLPRFGGLVLVLRPHSPGDYVGDLPLRVVFHAASREALEDLDGRRVILQCATSIYDGGMDLDELETLVPFLEEGVVEGYSLSLPLERHGAGRQLAEIAAWIEWLRSAAVSPLRVYVNHVSDTEIRALRGRYPDADIQARLGTRLWLGDTTALHVTGTVIAVESVPRGGRFGYRQRRARADVNIVTVVGGTTHGVGLQAPKMARGRERLKTVSRAGMAALNLHMSPFSWKERRLWFAEPPHMSVSMLVVPKGVEPPSPGCLLPARLRYTTTRFDRVEIGAHPG